MAWRICGHALAISSRLTSRPPLHQVLQGANGRLAFASCTLPSTARRPEGSASPVCPAPCSHGTRCDFPRRMTTLTMVRCSRVSSPPTEASSKPQAPRTTSARRSAPFSRRWLPRQRPFSCTVRREKIVSNPSSPFSGTPSAPAATLKGPTLPVPVRSFSPPHPAQPYSKSPTPNKHTR